MAPFDTQAHAATTGRTVVYIEQMDCPIEERIVRTKLDSTGGIIAPDSNLFERYLTIHHTVGDVTSFLEALQAIGMDGEMLRQRERLSAAFTESTRVSCRAWLLGVGGVTAFGTEAITWSPGDHV